MARGAGNAGSPAPRQQSVHRVNDTPPDSKRGARPDPVLRANRPPAVPWTSGSIVSSRPARRRTADPSAPSSATGSRRWSTAGRLAGRSPLPAAPSAPSPSRSLPSGTTGLAAASTIQGGGHPSSGRVALTSLQTIAPGWRLDETGLTLAGRWIVVLGRVLSAVLIGPFALPVGSRIRRGGDGAPDRESCCPLEVSPLKENPCHK